ncbi:HesB/IscA family protein [Xanthobacter sp. TB0136]|uniref:HesB/IscA family protein n=1 Tax=Xanthobacter sp. TB0136 TaxID=3459177 RepID=UPI004039B9F6
MSEVSVTGTSGRTAPPVLTITDEAAERLKELIADQEDEGMMLRLGVAKSGCAGMAYTMDYTDEITPFDTVVDQKGVRVVIDSKALMFLLGTQMDFKTDKMSAQFVFNNPNQVSACGCGESVELSPVDPASCPRTAS